ncbi:MAG: DUF5665 domain-containing protein [Firmicutes bacterium]|nr:DUF5665 domain-containing protein [Bacillota bacterium]
MTKPVNQPTQKHRPEDIKEIPENTALEQETFGTTITRAEIERLTQFADYLTRLNLVEYIKLTQKPTRMLRINFISGVARGFGMAVGFTLLGAFGIYVLNKLQVLNLPVIGDFIAKVWEYVEMARKMRI